MKLRMILSVLLVISSPTMVIAAAPPLTSSTSLQRVLEGASKEGKLHIWYSTPSEAKTWDALKEAFQKRLNLKVDLTRTFVFSTDQPARLAAEGRTRVLSADISQVSLSKQNVDLQKQLGLFEVTDWVGLFASVWPEIKEVVDFEPKLLRGYGLRLQDFVRGIVYNTRMIAEKDVPGTLEAYTQPKWHGNIVFGEPYMDPLPRLHSFPEWPLNRVVETGKAFLANKPLFPRGGVEATEFVARGETAVHLHSAWATYAKKKADGAPIGFKPFDKFVVVHGNAFTPLTTARNPNMARLFIAWYAMEGAQISEKMEYRSAVVHPGTQIKKIFDEVKRGRVVVTDNSLEDIERRNEYERALRKLVQR